MHFLFIALICFYSIEELCIDFFIQGCLYHGKEDFDLLLKPLQEWLICTGFDQ